MKTLNGTEKQIAYANSLINEFLEPKRTRNELLESRGLENLKEAHQKRHAENAAWIEAVENMKIEDAGRVINLFQNLNGGGCDLASFIEITQK